MGAELISKEDRDLEHLITFRLSTALTLGFTLDEAEVVAGSTIDMHELRKLVGSGCPCGLALRILV